MQLRDQLRRLATRKIVIAILLVAVVAIPYHNIFGNEFAYDDADFVLRWDGVTSLENIPSFFVGNLPAQHQHVYRPLRSVAQALMYQVSGTDPIGYHVFSLIVHLLGVLCIYLIARKLFDPVTGLVAGIIFGVMPVHTESITFITASFDTLGVVAALASFYWYALFRSSNDTRLLILSMIAAVVGFFTYEIALSLPLLIVLYDLCFSTERPVFSKQRLTIYAVYLAGPILWAIAKFGIAAQTYTGTLYESIPFFPRMLTMAKAATLYLYLSIVNFPLSVRYNIPIATSLADLYATGSLMLIAVLIWLAVYSYRKEKKQYTFFIAWFFLALVPVANVVQIARFIAEGYAYLASAAWALAAGFLYSRLIQKNNSFAIGATVCLVLLTLLYGSVTIARNTDWRSDRTLCEREVARQPNVAFGYNCLAQYYRSTGETSRAIQYAEQAVAVNPSYYGAYEALGEIHLEQGNYEEAVINLEKAASITPGFVITHHNLGNAYQALERYDQSIAAYQTALAIYPDNYESVMNLAIVYGKVGQLDDSISLFERAIVLRPRIAQPYVGAGIAHQEKGDASAAERYYRMALDIEPGNTAAQALLQHVSSSDDVAPNH